MVASKMPSSIQFFKLRACLAKHKKGNTSMAKLLDIVKPGVVTGEDVQKFCLCKRA